MAIVVKEKTHSKHMPRRHRRRVRCDGIELQDADSLLAQLDRWIEDYNTHALPSALGIRSPAEYRSNVTLSSSR